VVAILRCGWRNDSSSFEFPGWLPVRLRYSPISIGSLGFRDHSLSEPS